MARLSFFRGVVRPSRLHTPVLLTGALLLAGMSGCSEDDPVVPDPARAQFTLRIENIGQAFPFLKSGVFNTPVGATDPGAIGPGGAYEFSFTAGPGSQLSFATMFVPSNDFFFGPDETGISLFQGDGTPVSGDVTAQIQLWDAGTEVNQEPGLGPDQVQRQTGANTGAADADATVRLASDEFANLPAVSAVVRVTITPSEGTRFTVRIENVSTSTTLLTSDAATQAVPLSPGVWVVHGGDAPLFTPGQADRGDGLEAIAEDGGPSDLAAALAADEGVTVPASPGVWAVHTAMDPLFTDGQMDRGDGLEAIAEDGNPANLAAVLAVQAGVVASGVFNTPEGAGAPSAIGPGGAYEIVFEGAEGDMLSFASMFVPSNDLFFSPDGNGIALFNGTTPVSGDVTSQVTLWDAGTEVNQEPGVGLDQVQRQSGADTGASEGGTVRRVATTGDGFSYPATTMVLRVTLTSSPLP